MAASAPTIVDESTGGIVLHRWRPTPGERTEDFELPGPGTYEIDFGVPDFVIPDFTSQRVATFPVGDYKVTHLRTKSVGNTLTIRLKIEHDAEKPQGPTTEWVGVALSLGRVLIAIAGASVGVWAMNLILKVVREVRLIVTAVPKPALGALAIAGAAFVLVGLWKGR